KGTSDASLTGVAMLSVYRVIPNLDQYQYFMADDISLVMKNRFDGTSVRSNWEAPTIYRANPKKPRPDIWGCMSFGAVFAVGLKAASELVTFIDQSCEGLPIECDGEKFLICNISCVVNALDEKQSSHIERLPHWIENYSFLPKRFEYSLFKIP